MELVKLAAASILYSRAHNKTMQKQGSIFSFLNGLSMLGLLGGGAVAATKLFPNYWAHIRNNLLNRVQEQLGTWPNNQRLMEEPRQVQTHYQGPRIPFRDAPTAT